jgi:hypothetical protein
VVHVGQDVLTARKRRTKTELISRDLQARLPAGSAVFTWTVYRNTAAPLQLHRDVIIVDASRDHGRDAPKLIAQLMNRGRRVFLLKNGFDELELARLTNWFGIRGYQRGLAELIELGGKRRYGSRHQRVPGR